MKYCVQLTAFQLLHCRHFENGGKVVCISADTLRAQIWNAKLMGGDAEVWTVAVNDLKMISSP